MKKIYGLLMMAMFIISGTAQARYWEASTGDPVLTPEENVDYLLVLGTTNETMSAKAFLQYDGHIQTSWATANEVWRFEQNGDNWRIYYTNAEGQRQYLSNAENIARGLTTTTASRIGNFLVEEAISSSAEDAEAEGLEHYTTVAVDGQVMIIDAASNKYFQCAGTGTNNIATFGVNTAQNVWYLLEAQEMGGYNYLDAVMNELFPNEFDPEVYDCGNNPGQYREDALAALIEAYEAANEAASEEEALTLTDALLKAWEDFQNSFISFQAGYYIFTNYRDPIGGALYDNTDNIDGDTGSTYAGRTVNGLKWCYSSSHEGDNANHTFIYNGELEGDEWYEQAGLGYMVWQVIDTETPNRYYFRNWKTGNYIHVIDTNNKQVPVVKEPTDVDLYTMEPNPNYPGFWTLYNDNNWVCQGEVSGIHAAGDYANTVAWKKSADASCWAIRTVTEEDLAIILDRERQPMLNMQLTTLVNEVKTAINNSQIWSIFDTQTNEVAENLNVFESLEVEGLVTDPEQLSTNAQESSEGPIENLLDGDCSTFFHSAWNNNDAPKVEIEDPETGDVTEQNAKHFIQFDLNDQYQQLTVKWFTRGNADVQGRLTECKVYVSNDGDEFAELESPIQFHYTPFDAAHKVTVEGAAQNCWVGVASFDLGAKYQFVRIEATKQAHTQAIPWFNGSEVRVYEGLLYDYRYDVKNSPYESVPAAVKENLNTLLETANAEIEDGLATEETIAALQAAFESFKDNLPNLDRVNALKAEAQAQAEAAEYSDEVGYFAVGAGDELLSVVNSINLTSGSCTVDEIKAAVAQLEKAIAAFNSKLNKPVNGKFYLLRSATEGGKNFLESKEDPTEEDTETSIKNFADQDYVGVRNANSVNVAWGGEQYENDIDAFIGYVWKAETNADGTFSLRHVLTGRYMGCEAVNNANVVLVEATDTLKANFTYQSAKIPGILNIVFADKVFLNCQPGTNNVVTWNSASGHDNSAIEFVETEEPGTEWDFELNSFEGLRVMVLPVAVTDVEGCYEVAGQSQQGEEYFVELREIKGEIAAGTPFIFDPQSYETAIFTVANAEPSFASQPVNGLVGTFEDVELPATGYGVLTHKTVGEEVVTTIVQGDKGDAIAAGFGYLTNDMTAVEYGVGDLRIACSDPITAGLAESISHITLNSSKAMYDLQGRRIQKSVKGLYIVNGKKYIVK